MRRGSCGPLKSSISPSSPQGLPHPGVQKAVGEVHGQVHQHVHRRQAQNVGLDGRVVPSNDALDGKVSEARPGEDDLQKGRPAQKGPEGHAGQGYSISKSR